MKKKSLFIFTLGIVWIFTPVARAQDAVEPRGFNYATSGFTLFYNDQKFTVGNQTLSDWQGGSTRPAYSSVDWQAPDPANAAAVFFGLNSPATTPAFTTYRYRLDKIYDYVSKLAPGIDQPAAEPNLVIQNNRVTDFNPGQTGITLNALQTTLTIAAALENNTASTGVATEQIQPHTTLGQTNSLGVNELVAEGVSKFNGSPNNRRHNIAVGVEKMKGLLVAPGATFSFDDNLGPVDGDHGFLPELVIKKNDTVPEFGGGLCQVSTTVFRAAMNGGLPIPERRNHAYAVQYYSPQGTDATIYPGIVDLKFVNDTANYLLIWPYLKDANTLIFDFYGTRDNRQVTLQKPVVYDRQPDGSMKATWTRIVTRDGQTSTSTFKSVYQSPSLFHHDEQFVTSTPVAISVPAKIQ